MAVYETVYATEEEDEEDLRFDDNDSFDDGHLDDLDQTHDAFDEPPDEESSLVDTTRPEAAVLLASVVATTLWQATERILLEAFVQWLEFAARLADLDSPKPKRSGRPPLPLATNGHASPTGRPPLPPATNGHASPTNGVAATMLARSVSKLDVGTAWNRWADTVWRLVRCRQMATRTVARVLRFRDWRRVALGLAWRAWRRVPDRARRKGGDSAARRRAALAVVVWRRRARRSALKAAWARLATGTMGDDEVARVAAEHLNKVTAANRDLRRTANKALRRGRQLATRVLATRWRRIQSASLLGDAWHKWTTNLRAPRRGGPPSRDAVDDVAIGLKALQPNTPLLRDVFGRYAVAGSAPDGAVALVLALDRLWALAKDFAIAPAFASYSLLMQLAHDELHHSTWDAHSSSTSTPSPKNCVRRTRSSHNHSAKHRVKPHYAKQDALLALTFDQFLALLVRLALHDRDSTLDDEDDAEEEDEPEFLVHAIVRAMDSSPGLAKVGLLSKRFTHPQPHAALARPHWTTPPPLRRR